MKELKKSGLFSLILSLISISLFIIIYWALETRVFWDFTNSVLILYFFDFIILLSLILATIFGMISFSTFKLKNKFGIAGLLISITTILLVIILVIPNLFIVTS